MRQVRGTTVFVLGAGASAHAGAPLLCDFIPRARDLMDGESVSRPEAYSRVFKYIQDAKAATYRVDMDLDNLEHVWSLLELQSQMGWPDAADVSDALRHVVCDVLDHVVLPWGDHGWVPDPVYKTFAGRLRAQEKGRDGERQSRGAASCVVTFNYDALLDHAIVHENMCPVYEPGEGTLSMHLPVQMERTYAVLKLHGSVTWGQCPKCRKLVQVVSPVVDYPTLPMDEGTKVRMDIMAAKLGRAGCSRCNVTGLVPYMVPPTWSKRIEETPLVPVWTSAADALRRAQQVVVIGYSMPASDTFMRYLLATALMANDRFERVVVVNRHVDGELEKRYRSVFGGGSRNAGLVKFVEMPFEQFVRDPEFERVWEFD